MTSDSDKNCIIKFFIQNKNVGTNLETVSKFVFVTFYDKIAAGDAFVLIVQHISSLFLVEW